MTVGYPDYQGYPIWRGGPIFAGAITVTSIAPVTKQGYVTAFSSLYIGVTGPANGVSVAITYFDSAAQLVQYNTVSFVVIAGTGLQYLIPNQGNYVVVTVTTTQAGNQNVTLTLQPTSVSVSRPTYVGTGDRVAVLNTSVAASGTNTHLLPAIVHGPGVLAFRPVDATGKLNVRVRRLSEGATEIDDHAWSFGAVAATQVPFQSAGQPISVSVFNSDTTTAHSYDLACQVLAA